MALLDVTELLVDPDLVASAATPWTVTRQVTTVGADGRATSTARTFTPLGVVYPDRVNLDLQADSSRVSGRIRVVTTFRLNTLTDSGAADLVTWQGKTYVVQVVEDYTSFGAGFVQATCELQALTSAQLS